MGKQGWIYCLVFLLSVVTEAGVDAGGGKGTNFATPTAETDAANKKYVDDNSPGPVGTGIHDLISAAHGDTTNSTPPARGSLIYGNATLKWDELVVGSALGAIATSFFGSNGTDIGYRTVSQVVSDLPLTHNVLSVRHSDTVANAVTRGSIIYGNSTPEWDELTAGTALGATATSFLGTDGTDAGYRTATQVLADLSTQAGADFDWNDKSLLKVHDLNLRAPTDGEVVLNMFEATADGPSATAEGFQWKYIDNEDVGGGREEEERLELIAFNAPPDAEEKILIEILRRPTPLGGTMTLFPTVIFRGNPNILADATGDIELVGDVLVGLFTTEASQDLYMQTADALAGDFDTRFGMFHGSPGFGFTWIHDSSEAELILYHHENEVGTTNKAITVDRASGDVTIHNDLADVGNISGSDLDISAGTGDYSSSGTIGSGAHTITVAGATADGLILNNTNELTNFLMARGDIGGTPAGVTLITQGSTGFNMMTDSGNDYIWRKNSIAEILAYDFASATTLMTLNPDGDLALLTGDLIIPNNGFIGSAGQPQAIKIDTNGNLILPNDNYIGSVGQPQSMQIDSAGDILFPNNITAANLGLGTGELTTGSINRASGTPLTLEIGGTAELSIATNLVTVKQDLTVTGIATAAEVNIGSLGDTDTLLAVGTTDTSDAGFAAMGEFISDSGNPTSNNLRAGITVEPCWSNPSGNRVGAQIASEINGISGTTNLFGIFGGARSLGAITGQSLNILGLDFEANHQEDFTGSGISGKQYQFGGIRTKAFFGWDGKTISGAITDPVYVRTADFEAHLDGTYNAVKAVVGNEPDGFVYALKTIVIDNGLDSTINDRNVTTYAGHFTAAADKTFTGDGSPGGLINHGILVLGDAAFGDGTNEVQISGTGDFSFAGTAGLLFGHMYVDGTQSIIVALTLNTPAEVEDDGTTSIEDGWLAGDLNGITFPTGGTQHYLTVTKAGVYHITWNLSFKMVTGAANTQIHAGLTVDSTTFVRDKCEAHRTISNNSDIGNMGGTCMIDLPNGNEELSLWMENTTNSNNADVVHGSITAVMVGGT
jgi:hypothetical protein